MCVATIPFPTIDNRFVDVFFEHRAADYLLIHDGGKAVNDLILQGIKITDFMHREFEMLAKRFDVAYADEMFQTGAKLGEVANKAYAVAMCSAVAMTRLLDGSRPLEESPINAQLATVLRRWGRRKARVQERVSVKGEVKQHEFDFVLHPRGSQPIALSILNPTAGPLSAAERFGFKSGDLKGTRYGQWKRVAVEVKAEVWSRDARMIVQRFSDAVIEAPSGQLPSFQDISATLDSLAAA